MDGSPSGRCRPLLAQERFGVRVLPGGSRSPTRSAEDPIEHQNEIPPVAEADVEQGNFDVFKEEIDDYVATRYRYENKSFIVKNQVYNSVIQYFGLANLSVNQMNTLTSKVGKAVHNLSRGCRKIEGHSVKVNGQQVWWNLTRRESN